MNEFQVLTLAFVAGAVLGTFFFGGLWWTVQKGVVSNRPELWFLGSLALRIGVILAGFYVVSQGHWSRLAACLVGFLMARVIVVHRLTRAPVGQALQPDNSQALQPDSAKDIRLESLAHQEEIHHAP